VVLDGAGDLVQPVRVIADPGLRENPLGDGRASV